MHVRVSACMTVTPGTPGSPLLRKPHFLIFVSIKKTLNAAASPLRPPAAPTTEIASATTLGGDPTAPSGSSFIIAADVNLKSIPASTSDAQKLAATPAAATG